MIIFDNMLDMSSVKRSTSARLHSVVSARTKYNTTKELKLS